MVKLKSDAIEKADLIEFLDSHSDFSFEINTLKALIEIGFICEHGGIYKDPATQIPREYDIRATRQIGEKFLRLAVECKNLRPNYPLLISCLPRRQEESFHELSISVKPRTVFKDNYGNIQHLTAKTVAMISNFQTCRLKNTMNTKNSLYPVDAPVGKSCDQVGRSKNNNEIVSGDSGIYNKWSQALSSAHDLVSLIFSDGQRSGMTAISLVFPLVVVPNEKLWRIQYDINGNRISDPELVDRCSFFVNQQYSYPSKYKDKKFVISHLEFVTSKGLLDFVNYLCSDDAERLYKKSNEE